MKAAGLATRALRPQQRQVALRELTDCLLDAYDFVSRRAYEKFQCRGGTNIEKSDALREDWLHAESEILGRLDVQIENAADYVSALATLPGFTAADMEVGIESRWLVIFGSRKSAAKDVDEEWAERAAIGAREIAPDSAKRSGWNRKESRASNDAGMREESRERRRIENLPEPVTDVCVQPGAGNDFAGIAGGAWAFLPRQIFSVIELLAEVDPERCRAVMTSGLLGVRMSKKSSRC